MIGKNNQYLKKTKEGTKVETYSIKKFKVGTASVVIGASIFFGAGAVAQASEEVSKNTTTDNSKNEGATLGGEVSGKVVANPVAKETTKEEVAAGVAAKLGVKEPVKETEKVAEKEPVKTLDKTQLSSFISEIERKISSGAYANKTEESVANLATDLNGAKATLESATTQEELTKAYQKLVVSVNSKLRNKPVEKKETPVVDSTIPKETVGKEAENTEKKVETNPAENVEKKVETNSIENTGAKDPRNGKEIAKNITFRAAVNQDPKVDFTFSIPDEKKIYIYNEEHFSLEIPVYSETGKIRYATIKKGSRQRFPNVAGTENDLDVEFGFTATVINRAETAGVTSDASQANPAKIVITGRPNDILKKHRDYTKQENQTLNVGTRYIQVVDDQGRENLKKGDSIADPGYFYLVLKSQAKKYALRSQGTDEKISVSSLTNPTAEDLKKIKDSIQLEYSTTNEDARFADKRGTLVEHPEDVIQSVNIVGNNIVVTFTDGSTKTKPVSEIVQKNIPPVVNLPYSNEANRNIYIYSGEETDLTFTATDESKIKDLKLRGPGDINYNNATSFGLAVGNIVDSAVTSGEGSVSEDKKTATIKMTGTTNLGDGKKWTSVIVAKDDNNGESAPFNGRINATTNPAERQKIAGYVEFVVKNQTKKYDIKAPEGTVSVIDPTNVTAEEFEKIKEKVKIEYSQTNDDANLTSKRGQAVDNQATRISTITKDANGNLVVTYKDGSTDTKSLSEYVSLNKQPAIDAINTAADNKIAEINSNTNATSEEKAAAIEKVNADKAKALTAINDNSVTTKAALDNAKTSGTTAISNDNPVVTKKDTAKAAIDTALREKEAAIDANNTLTTEEKNAAKADAQAKATAAKTAIDNATTNAAVDSAKTAGTTSVGSVNPTAVAKPAAKKAIEDALNAKIAQLDGRNDLTTEEKNAAKADATARANAAKTAIDNATTDETVASAKTSGVSDVESVNPQASQKKTDAKNAVDEALKAKEAAIDANNDLTAEEKAKAKEDAKAKADAAKQAIDNATTNAAVEQAKADGATSVGSVTPTAQAKPAAKKAIDDALKAKNDAIDANNDLTAEEKAKAKEDAKAKADAAKTAIDNATTNAGVEQAKTDGATSVDSINPMPVAKPAAKKAVDDALADKIKAIEANNDLTDEEKTAAKQEAQDKATAAKQAIDNATTNAGVDQAKANGTTEVNNVNPTPVAKPAAKKAIDDALKVKEAAIDANNDLTDEEKAAAKQEAQDKAAAAKTAIDNATTNAAVDQAKVNGRTEVNNVNPMPVAKPAAKKAIEDALKAKEAAIDANNDLTAEEKAAAKQEAQDKAAAAKTAIDNATTNAGVEQAKVNGTTEVNNVNPTPVAKPAAKTVIDNALKAKEAEIDARDDLTAEEKIAAKEEAKAKADAAKQAVDKATTNADVENAKTTGVADVNSLNPVAVKKPEAKKAVDEALKAKEAEIDANNDLTAEEKQAAKEEAKKKADAAKQAIDEADTDIKVDVNSISGLSDVNSFSPEPVKKPEAKKAIDAALEKKIEEIDARDDLTTEEKTAAKAEAENKANEAKEAIDAADTDIKVDVNSISGLSDVNSFSPEAAKKPAAKQAIDDALKAKEDAIDANNDLTAEEKAKAKAEAKAKADAAKEAIDNATTNAEVEQAKTAGTTSVDSVNPVAVKKPAAKQSIDEALKAKNDEIDARTDLIDEEKTAAKAEAKKKADLAKEAIDNATTNAEVEQAKTVGTTSVDSVNPTAQAKPAAKKAIDDTLKTKNDAIDARTDLTDEEKATAKEEAKKKADAAKQAIDNATTNAGVEQAKANGTTEVKAVDPQPVAKTEAKKAIDDALKAKNDEIDARTDLTDEEKTVAKKDAKAKADAAKEAIDNAPTNAGVEQAKANGTTEVKAVDPQPEAKTEAKKAIEDVLKAKNDEIDARTDLTDEEKAKAKEEAKKKADAAKQAIDNATTNAGVEQAKANGTTEVKAVDPQPEAKTEAKEAIDDALKAKNDEIDARSDLTDEEKAAAKQEAQDKAAAAKETIDNATTNAAVDQAKDNGTTEVNNVNPTAQAKPAAKQAIDDALKAKNDEIDARTDLTDEEKAKAKEEAKKKADAAKETIDNATTNEGVEQAKTNGITEVNNVNPEAVAKPAAKQAIDEALKAKNDEIDARTDLTDEEKTAAKAETKKKADAAKEAIDKATTNAEVEQAKTNGTSEVTSVNPQPEAKTEAKKAIDEALKAKNDEIDARTDLTDEEKTAAKEEAKKKADAAKEAIDNATINAEVDQAKDNGTTEVKAVNPQPVAKTEAKKAIDEALKAKNDEIDARTDLTDEEKVKAKAETKAKADAAKEAIDNATTNAGVEQAKVNGTTEVNSVNPEAVAKTEAKKAIDETLKAKNDEIDARTDLTDEEKTAAKANAKAIADGAKEVIDKATTNAEVEQAKTNGTSEVTSVNPEPVAKTEAKKAIDEALKAKNDEIDARTDLTDEEKIAAKADAKAKADAAKIAIDNATTNVEVDQAKVNGTTEVTSVNPEAVVKSEAKKAIDDTLKAKNDEIDARTDLTDEEKTAAKAYAQAKANAAKEEIDKATTNAEVDQAKTNGTLDVTSVDPQPVAKPEAKKAIDDALKAKNDEIDARTDLTDEEKVKAKEEAKEKADAAKKAIDRATTDEEVEQTEINGTTEVKAVDPEAIAKTEAKKAIDEVLKAKNDEIDARTDLTDEEKTAAKAEAKAKADAAKEGIDIATTNVEIDQVKKNGTTEVASVNPEAVAKTEAKEAIEDALKAKNDEIDARTDLTDEEKTAAKAEAKAKADTAKEGIDRATTNSEVGQAKTTGVTEVTSVNPEALVKSAAKKAIDDKLAEQLKVIANTPDATDEEKKAAADLAKQLAEVAKKAIDAARENADVKKLQDNSKVGIEEAVPFVEDKPNARKAIDEEAKAKKAAIDARTDISDKVKELLKAEVDEIATQAKKEIDAASSVNVLNKIEEAKKSEIRAVEEVRVPAEKVIVADPTKLTNEEKAKVLAAIRSVNPDAKEITQDEKGNVVVVTANGHKQVISVAQVTKTEADLVKENAGNVVNTPVAKTAVTDVTKLTEAEKQEIIAKVKVVNPGATVAIDEKGNVIVTNGEGLVFVLPVLDLVIPTDKLTDITANSKVNTPAIRTLVANKGSLTPEEIAKIKAAIEEINPGAIVVVDSKGNATVTTRDGKSMTISSDVLVKDAADVAVKNNGENINLDFDKEVVADINNLTESDKEKVKFKVLGAIREAVELVVDEKGNATVILKDGRTFTILAKDIFEQRKEVTVNLPGKVKVKDASNLTEAEKEAVKQALITANPNLKDAKITISNTGEATIVYPDGQVVVISAKNLVVAEKVTGVIIEGNSGTYTREDKKPMVDSSNDNTPKFNAKKGQRLANTGEAETNTGLAGIGMALLGGLLAAAKRRKEKEE